ncbi:hypothetical protein GQ42DRAFT_169462 [Ramicandelaber brevisporus]|nr:hypothetical protein GQ42DRAFT_169462 [Ramicandelaber brevisporus]
MADTPSKALLGPGDLSRRFRETVTTQSTPSDEALPHDTTDTAVGSESIVQQDVIQSNPVELADCMSPPPAKRQHLEQAGEEPVIEEEPVADYIEPTVEDAAPQE